MNCTPNYVLGSPPIRELPTRKRIASFALLGAFLLLCLSRTATANTEVYVVSGSSDLTQPGAYSTSSSSDVPLGSLPSSSNDVAFSGAYSPAALSSSTNGFNLNIGTLDDISSTSLVLSNTIAGSVSTITLNGGSDSVSGAAASDLLYESTGSLTLGGGVGALNLSLGAAGNFDVAGGTMTIDSNINDNGHGVTKTGVGTLILNGAASTITGGFTISNGIVENSGSAGTPFGSGNITFGSGGSTVALIVRGAATAYTVTTGLLAGTNTAAIIENNGGGVGTPTLVLSGTGTATFDGILRADPGQTYVVNIVVASGTEILGGANTSASSLGISGGTLQIGTGTTGSVVAGSNAVIASGGVFAVLGNSTGSTTQTFKSLSVAGSQSQVTVNSNGGSGTTVALGGISRTVGSTVNFTLPASGSITTTATNTNGIIGGYATVGGLNWATSASNGSTPGALTALANYLADTWGIGMNTNVTQNDSPAAGSMTNSLRFNLGGGLAVNLTGTNVVTSGGILVTTNVGASGASILGGTIEGSAGGDLIVIQNDTASSFLIGSNIADDGTATALTKAGSGMLVLTGSDTFTGGLFIDGGTVQEGSYDTNGALSTGVITLAASTTPVTLDLNGNSPTIGGLSGSGTNGIVTNTASGTPSVVTISNTGTEVFGGRIQDGSGGIGISLNLPGTLSLTGSNTYSGATTLNGGTLNIGNGTSSGSINSGSTLVLQGGLLTLTRTGTFAQSFAGTAVNEGASAVTVTNSTDTINLGAITRNLGGTIDFGNTGTITTTSTNTNGILGGYATYSGTTWAVSASNGSTPGSISGLGAYTTTASAGTNAASYNAQNIDVTSSTSVISASIAPSSLRFNTPGAETLALSGGGVNVISSGGILVTANVGNFASTIRNGLLTGPSGGDLVVIDNDVSNSLTIASEIVDNNGVPTALTFSGPGTLNLTSPNSYYSAGTYINGGLVTTAATNSLGTGTITLGAAYSGSAAALDFLGSAGGNNSVNNITVNPGGARSIYETGVGTATTGPISLVGGVTLYYGLAGTQSGNISPTGGISGAGNVVFGTPLNSISSTLSFTGADINNSGYVSDGAGPTGNSFSGIISFDSASDIDLNVTALLLTNPNVEVQLYSTNDFSGDTILTSGTLDMQNPYALQNSTLKLAGGKFILDNGVDGSLVYLGGLAGTTNLTLADTMNNAVGLRLGNFNSPDNNPAYPNTVNPVYSGSLLQGVGAAGAASLTMYGSNIQTLAATNNYTGATTIQSGTLIVSGSLNATTSVVVDNPYSTSTPGELIESGTGLYKNAINSAASLSIGVSNNGGEFALSNDGKNISATTQSSQTFTTLTTGSFATIDMGSNTTGDGNSLIFTGAVSATSGFQLTILDWSGGRYGLGATSDPGTNLLQDRILFAVNPNFGALGTLLTGVSFYNDSGAFLGYGEVVRDSANGDYEIVAVPEPASWAMLLGGCGMFFLARKRGRGAGGIRGGDRLREERLESSDGTA